jgi:hypothetical protein
MFVIVLAAKDIFTYIKQIWNWWQVKFHQHNFILLLFYLYKGHKMSL